MPFGSNCCILAELMPEDCTSIDLMNPIRNQGNQSDLQKYHLGQHSWFSYLMIHATAFWSPSPETAIHFPSPFACSPSCWPSADSVGWSCFITLQLRGHLKIYHLEGWIIAGRVGCFVGSTFDIITWEAPVVCLDSAFLISYLENLK